MLTRRSFIAGAALGAAAVLSPAAFDAYATDKDPSDWIVELMNDTLNDISKDVLLKISAADLFDFLKAWAEEFKPELLHIFADRAYLEKILDIGRHEERNPRKDHIYAQQIIQNISYFFDDLFEIEDDFPQEAAGDVPTIIEKNQGIFEKTFGDMGIEVDYAELTSGADQTQALASGDVQVLYAVGGTSVILSAANGADIKVLNMYSRSPKAFCMYSKDESLTTPESLRGKTIAGPTGTNLHELLVSYLATAGMTIDDVNYVNMSIPDAKAGLDGGSVDVALVAGATAYNAGQQGYHLVADGEGLIKAIIAVAVTQKFYDEHPEIIEKLEEAQTEIADFKEEKPDETMQIVAEELDLDTDAVKSMYDLYDFSTEITDDDKEGFQKTADFMYESGMIDEAFDVKQLFIEK